MLTNHFSQASGRIATKLAHDGLQVSVHPRCAQGQRQGQRSRDTGTFVLARKSLLGDYWDTWNYSLFTSSLQSTISCIAIQFARWQHNCGRSLLSTIDLFQERLGIFSRHFTCLSHVPIYTGVQIPIQLSSTLTKLRHVKRDHHYALHQWLKRTLGGST